MGEDVWKAPEGGGRPTAGKGDVVKPRRDWLIPTIAVGGSVLLFGGTLALSNVIPSGHSSELPDDYVPDWIGGYVTHPDSTTLVIVLELCPDDGLDEYWLTSQTSEEVEFYAALWGLYGYGCQERALTSITISLEEPLGDRQVRFVYGGEVHPYAGPLPDIDDTIVGYVAGPHGTDLGLVLEVCVGDGYDWHARLAEATPDRVEVYLGYSDWTGECDETELVQISSHLEAGLLDDRRLVSQAGGEIRLYDGDPPPLLTWPPPDRDDV